MHPNPEQMLPLPELDRQEPDGIMTKAPFPGGFPSHPESEALKPGEGKDLPTAAGGLSPCSLFSYPVLTPRAGGRSVAWSFQGQL